MQYERNPHDYRANGERLTVHGALGKIREKFRRSRITSRGRRGTGASKWIHLLPVSQFCETGPRGAISRIFAISHANTREICETRNAAVARGRHNCAAHNEL